MSNQIFVSYRRDDAAMDAIALCGVLRNAFGDESVFMDTESLQGGDEWPDVLRRSVATAEAVIVLIGPDWVKISDAWGRRRIDQKDDWVRLEISAALDIPGKLVIPVLVRGAKLPPDDALPEMIRPLHRRNAIELRRDYFNHDIELLLAQLKSKATGKTIVEAGGSPYPVKPPDRPEEISGDRLSRILASDLKRWAKVESPLPENPDIIRVELFRELKFKSFTHAIAFMAQVAPGCEIAMHHPRWENIFRTLRVYLSTWDIDHRISDRDVQLARYFDRAYSEFEGRSATA